MKKLLVILLLFFPVHGAWADCSACESEAYDAYRDAKRAYNSSDLSDCQYYARKAKRHFSYAESEAYSCSCNDAESEAWSGKKDARRAYNSSNLSDCQYYARKAKKHASWAEDYARSCN